MLSPPALTVAEGEKGSYTVHLASAPTGTVTVAIASDNGDVSMSPAALAFHASGSNSELVVAEQERAEVRLTAGVPSATMVVHGGPQHMVPTAPAERDMAP
ncbi:MAG: hypothetical protein F4X84_06220 [Synechococcus sp. SB0662_bin_45]|nr:hypothetical protein [Cyanobacteria bacterium MAG IRC4_bin_6]MXW11854.1 hypothetical protein [Synechococcus sp. SB0668_bin_13]MXY19015.1 hypothetical protein [Synechococcus sp. SB0664_bin_36]MYE21937.1 hypothetical protein [Synechococcus sp. SB0662_bin_45]MYF19664.1 hypothetical protein [Synechococcus sp. SB0677_bin_5]MYK84881.1 hypothetical protein [Synechococcus sp. SB0669_bin_7]